MQETTCNAGDLGSIPGSESSTWRRKWQPTPVFLPGEFHGQKGLAGSSPFGQRSQTRLSDYTATAIQQCSLFSYFKGLENKMIQRKKFPLKEFPLYLLFPLPPYWIITELTRLTHDDKICQAVRQAPTSLSSWGEVISGFNLVSIFLIILKLGSEDNLAL